MPIKLVRYHTKPEMADQNERLIADVFRELHSKKPFGLRYLVVRLPEDEFLHLYSVDEDAAPITELDAFQAFREGSARRFSENPQALDGITVGVFGAWDALTAGGSGEG